MQGLVWAIGGTPASELGPARPGLMQLMQELTKQVGDLQDWTKRHDDFHEKQGHETEPPPR